MTNRDIGKHLLKLPRIITEIVLECDSGPQTKILQE